MPRASSPSRRYSTDLTDEQWALIRPLVERDRRMGRLLPIDFPNWNTVRFYFDAWTLDGTFMRFNDALRTRARQRVGRAPEPSAGIIDRKTCEDDRSRRRPRLRWGKKGDRSQAAHPG
jgi:transposase